MYREYLNIENLSSLGSIIAFTFNEHHLIREIICVIVSVGNYLFEYLYLLSSTSGWLHFIIDFFFMFGRRSTQGAALRKEPHTRHLFEGKFLQEILIIVLV